MNHFMLKFNHGVEIGARLAYIGHYERTKESGIKHIIFEEEQHRDMLLRILHKYGERSNKHIDGFFTKVGSTIGSLCKFMPRWSLDYVARTMETFAIFNYGYLAVRYPLYQHTFLDMARSEARHEEYFTLGEIQYLRLQILRESIKGGRLGEKCD